MSGNLSGKEEKWRGEKREGREERGGGRERREGRGGEGEKNTSMQVAVRLIGREEEGVASKHLDDIKEEDTEAAHISWVEVIEVAGQALLTMGCCVVASTAHTVVTYH